MTGNDFVSFILRTPFNVFLGNTMLIMATGCRTGKKYSTPVGFYRDGDRLWVMSSRDRIWWRNLKHGANVSLLLNGKTIHANGEAELDESAVEARLLDYIRRIPMAAKPLGIRMEHKAPNLEDVRRAAKDRLFVKIHPA
jgi:hypothetical protein